MSRLDPIPVTLVTEPGQLLPLDGDTVLIRLPANTGHGHADGDSCVACAAQTDVRTLLYNLLESHRRGMRPAFRRVVVDASAVADPQTVVAALTGRLPAQALRDHTVARLFYLAGAA
jgi:Putative GTPases (G3E family)